MSSSEEDDEGGRIRFTTEGDYDEGQWMDDGEFYARGGVRMGLSREEDRKQGGKEEGGGWGGSMRTPHSASMWKGRE